MLFSCSEDVMRHRPAYKRKCFFGAYSLVGSVGGRYGAGTSSDTTMRQPEKEQTGNGVGFWNLEAPSPGTHLPPTRPHLLTLPPK